MKYHDGATRHSYQRPQGHTNPWLSVEPGFSRGTTKHTRPTRQPRRECSCIIRLKSAPHEKVYTMSKEVGYRKRENPPRPPNPNHKISTRKTGAARWGGRYEQAAVVTAAVPPESLQPATRREGCSKLDLSAHAAVPCSVGWKAASLSRLTTTGRGHHPLHG